MASCYKYFLIVLLAHHFITLSAQDNIVYRNNHLHQVMMNPATAGSEFIPVAVVSYQKQWLGIDHSPAALLASASLRIGNFDFYNPQMMINTSRIRTREKIGLGFGIYTDQNGPAMNRGLYLAYAYHIRLSGSSLALGISGNMDQSLVNGASWDPLSSGDPLLESKKDSYFNFNANVGIFYSSNRYFGGFSANHVLPLENRMKPGEHIKQDYILHGGYLFRSLMAFKIEPSLNLRYLDYETLEYDIRAKLYLKHIHWVAISYRSYKALSISFGLKIERFYLAYQYESNLSRMIRYSAGSHGLNLGINLGMRGLERY